MGYDVSSSWFEKANSKSPVGLERRFTIGTSDYSEFVGKWPTIKRDYDDVRPLSVSLTLPNVNGEFNFFKDDKVNMRQQCAFRFGFDAEFITPFSGTVKRVAYSRGGIALTIEDKFKQLSERKMGSREAPVVYSGSTFIPSDIVWDAVTCYGGLSNIQSDSNPDVDYAAWLAYAAVFSADNVFTDAKFAGLKVTEVLRKVSRITDSAIYIENDQLIFRRFTLPTTAVNTFDDLNVRDITVSIDDDDLINSQFVLAAFNVESGSFEIEVTNTLSGSVNSYGLRQQTESDESFWYVNSSSALNFAERKTQTGGAPFERPVVHTGLSGLLVQIGDTVSVVDSFFGDSNIYRNLGYTFDMDTGKVTMRADESQLFRLFTLDVSELDGFDVLGG